MNPTMWTIVMVIGVRQRALAVALTSLVVFSPARAHAADDFEKARATGLVAEARALAEAGKLEEACARFEESVALHASENQDELAECWEKIGRTASAWYTSRR